MAQAATERNGAAATAQTPQAVVEAFLGALERLDIDAAMTLAHEDIEYQNVPLPPAHGARATERTLRSMLRFGTGFEARMLNIATEGDVVLTERIDVLEAGRFRMVFWVCGTFEVRDGRIVLWRDRFDFADTTMAVVRGLLGVVAPGLNRR